jgi:hypothetical protein
MSEAQIKKVLQTVSIKQSTLQKTNKSNDNENTQTNHQPATKLSEELCIKNSYNSDEDEVENSCKSKSRISMIISYGRELLCLILLVLTTYATYTNS